MRPFLLLALLAAGSYAVVCVLAGLFQKRLVFFPDPLLLGTPGELNLAYEDIAIECDDGIWIHAWFVPAPRARGAVLFCHGNGGNISHWLDTVRLLHDLEFAVLIFDYRGYGRSEGSPSEAGTYTDARAAWRHLVETRGFAPDSIVVVGRSLGAAVAVELASGVTPAALVLESPFTSLADVGRRAYPWLPVRLLLRMRYDSLERAPVLRIPKLFVHSRDDEVVPLEMGRRLFERAAEPKRFLEIRGSHNEGWTISRDAYVAGLRAFLESLHP
jgi:fermentation-respiration switch protein FrsA (DUF1100 family)